MFQKTKNLITIPYTNTLKINTQLIFQTDHYFLARQLKIILTSFNAKRIDRRKYRVSLTTRTKQYRGRRKI